MNWHEIPRSLQLRYLHAAAITVAQLGRLLAEVERDAGTGGRQALKLMLRRFYGLAAWAGLNGLAAVWVAAQRGEHDCSTLAASHVMPQPAHLDQIGAQVDVLRHEIYRLRTNGGIGDEILWAMPLPEGLLSAAPAPPPRPAAAAALDLDRGSVTGTFRVVRAGG